jgi:membrane-associated phospholipid phosphatase
MLQILIERKRMAMTSIIRFNLIMLIALTAWLAGLLMPQPAMADSFHRREAEFMSGTGNTFYLALGITLPLLTDEDEGPNHALRTLDAVITSDLITEALKRITHEERPNGSDDLSFPSGHATAAFAVARMESEYHPKQAWAWYLGAALIAESRVELDAHFVHDVVAGALVGYYTAEWELHNSHGLLLFPIIEPDRGTVGVVVAATF